MTTYRGSAENWLLLRVRTHTRTPSPPPRAPWSSLLTVLCAPPCSRSSLRLRMRCLRDCRRYPCWRSPAPGGTCGGCVACLITRACSSLRLRGACQFRACSAGILEGFPLVSSAGILACQRLLCGKLHNCRHCWTGVPLSRSQASARLASACQVVLS